MSDWKAVYIKDDHRQAVLQRLIASLEAVELQFGRDNYFIDYCGYVESKRGIYDRYKMTEAEFFANYKPPKGPNWRIFRIILHHLMWKDIKLCAYCIEVLALFQTAMEGGTTEALVALIDEWRKIPVEENENPHYKAFGPPGLCYDGYDAENMKQWALKILERFNKSIRS